MQRRSFHRLISAVAWLAVGGSAKASTPPAAARLLRPQRPVRWKDFLGVNAHLLWFTPQQYQQQIAQWKALGLEWLRVDLHWDRLEPEAQQYRLAELDALVQTLQVQKQKSVFYLVGSAPFATNAPRFSRSPDQYPPRDADVFAARMALLAQRYSSVDAWQIWNEPNLPSFWRPRANPEEYARLLQASVRALRQAAPGKTVVMGGMAYYSQMPGHGGLMLEALGRLGVVGLDTVVAYHPYSLHPEGDVARDSDFALRVSQLNRTLRGAGVRQIWATEWGWSSYAGPKEEQDIIGEQGQADYMLRRLALMSALDFDRIFLFALSDLDNRATPRDRGYGLLDLQGRPKPAYLALQRFLRLTGPVLEPIELPVIEGAGDDLHAISWRREDGKRLLLFWKASGGQLTLPGLMQAEVHHPLDGARRDLHGEKSLQLTALPSLQILIW